MKGKVLISDNRMISVENGAVTLSRVTESSMYLLSEAAADVTESGRRIPTYVTKWPNPS